MKKPNQNGFMLPIVIAVITIAVLGTGGYLAYKQYAKSQYANWQTNLSVQENTNTQNSDNETANWKTYTNTEYSFEIKYPQAAEIVTNNEDIMLWGGTKQVPIKINNDKSNNIGAGINVFIGTDEKSVSNCLKFNFYEVLENMTDTKEINGVNFYTKSQEDAAMGGERGIITQYSVIKSNICYTLQTQSHWRDITFVHEVTDGKTPTQEEIDTQNKKIQDQTDFLNSIVSTFKFIP